MEDSGDFSLVKFMSFQLVSSDGISTTVPISFLNEMSLFTNRLDFADSGSYRYTLK